MDICVVNLDYNMESAGKIANLYLLTLKKKYTSICGSCSIK